MVEENISYWIIFYLSELFVLALVIRKNYSNNIHTEHWRLSDLSATTILIIVTYFSAVASVGLFLSDSVKDYCIVDQLTKIPPNGTGARECVTKGEDQRWQLLGISVIAPIILLFVDIYQKSRRHT